MDSQNVPEATVTSVRPAKDLAHFRPTPPALALSGRDRKPGRAKRLDRACKAKTATRPGPAFETRLTRSSPDFPNRRPYDPRRSTGARQPRQRLSIALPPANRASRALESAYRLARERYAALGVDTDTVLKQLAKVPVSLHCWQGDDVGGFENAGGALGDGLAVTGNYPGKARTADELRADFEQVLALIPGRHRFNLHACYAEMARRRVDRDARGRPVPELDRLGEENSASGSTSTRPISPIPKVDRRLHPDASRTGPSASSGSSTASAAARSAPPSARPWARPASPTSGFRTA